ncbi:hypothetical protein [Streptomyces lanatus]|uniref:Integral membrane protein n=1 Tax=Streptomyces lanatus TaxID=66900 RepID=A0ABV1Y801_9ACTN|nr:hypothetical protein [Streptomyces lanatus]GHH31632.1 hypothetical protein GCM10018780_92770 [Streptomyces lanatus]
MSQPPFQPPQQPAQPPHDPNNPYAQPAPPQQAPGFGPPPVPGQPPMQAGPPPVPGQPSMPPGQPPMHPGAPGIPGQPQMYPMQPTSPFQAPYGQLPHTSGHPVGAVFLGFFASVIVSMLYSGLILATYKDMTLSQANTMYLGHALINGAVVGCLIGLVGHRNTGAHIWGAVIAAAGAFFGYTNALPLIIADNQSPAAIGDMMEADPFIPAKAWWNNETEGGVDWFSPLGLLLAAAAAWGLAYLIGSRRRRV